MAARPPPAPPARALLLALAGALLAPRAARGKWPSPGGGSPASPLGTRPPGAPRALLGRGRGGTLRGAWRRAGTRLRSARIRAPGSEGTPAAHPQPTAQVPAPRGRREPLAWGPEAACARSLGAQPWGRSRAFPSRGSSARVSFRLDSYTCRPGGCARVLSPCP